MQKPIMNVCTQNYRLSYQFNYKIQKYCNSKLDAIQSENNINNYLCVRHQRFHRLSIFLYGTNFDFILINN